MKLFSLLSALSLSPILSIGVLAGCTQSGNGGIRPTLPSNTAPNSGSGSLPAGAGAGSSDDGKGQVQGKTQKAAIGADLFCDQSGLAIADGPWLDPSLTATDCDRMRTLYGAIEAVKLNADPASDYAKLFAGTDADAATHFLNERLHYIVPYNAPLSISAGESTANFPASTGATVATNIGLGVWKVAQDFKAHGVTLTVNLGKSVLDPDAPSFGLVQLGQEFGDFAIVDQMATLMHEARHSDCVSTDSSVCGFPHSICPTGHDYAGMAACDDASVGAYYVGAVYSKTLGENCTNCSDVQEQEALLSSADSLSRVMNLDEVQSGKDPNYHLALVSGFDPASERLKFKQVRASRQAELGQ